MNLLFFGDNHFAMRRKLDEAVSKYTEKNGDIGLERLDGSAATSEMLYEKLTAMPFLASSRLVIIHALSENKQIDETALERTLSVIPTSTNAIFYETKPDKRSKLWKILKKHIKNAEFKKLEGNTLRAWLMHEVEDAGGLIDFSTASYLIDRVGSDQWRLYNEVNKLINFEKRITRESIDELVEPSIEESIFQLLDDVSSGRTLASLKRLDSLEKLGYQVTYLISMIGWQLRNLLLVASTKPEERLKLPSKTKISPYVVSKAENIIKKLDFETLVKGHDKIVVADKRLKTTGVDEEIYSRVLIGELTELFS